MLPRAEIEQYGGKGAILNYIRDKTSLSIPRYVVKRHDETLDSRLKELEPITWPIIARSSSPFEYGDFEGIFDSVRDVRDRGSLERAVRTVEASATSERAREYAKQNGFSIDEKMNVIIQEQSPSREMGAMIRLPNNPDVFVINIYYGFGLLRDYNKCFYSEKKGEVLQLGGIHSIGVKLEDVRTLVDCYKQIEDLREIGDSFSLYIEFGLKPFGVFQARPFKRLDTADFELPSLSGIEYKLDTDLCIGITSPEGVVLPVVRSLSKEMAKATAMDILRRIARGGIIDRNSELDFTREEVLLRSAFMNAIIVDPDNFDEHATRALREHNLKQDNPNGYCFMTSDAIREDYDVDLTAPNMHTFIHGESYVFLVHDIIRLIKKAKVSMLLNTLMYDRFFMNVGTGDRVRIISNGKEAVALKE